MMGPGVRTLPFPDSAFTVMDSPAAAPQAPANASSAFPLKPILWLLGSMTSLALGTSLAKQIFPIVGAQGTTALRLLFSALVLILFGRSWRHRMPRHDCGDGRHS